VTTSSPNNPTATPSPTSRFVVTLTGGIGSGKTTVANMFGELGAALVDTDAIAHRLSAPGGLAIAAISATFGAAFINQEGAMDRAKMRAHVFSDSTARKKLEAILHPLIRSETAREATDAQGDYVMLVVPLLVESADWKKRAGRVLVVDCSVETQIARVMLRNQLSRTEVEAIIAVQASRAQRLAAADDVIENDADAAALKPQIARLHAKYVRLAKTNDVQHL